MNVLETLKINNATILKIKEGDILYIKVDKDMNSKNIQELSDALIISIKEKGFENVTVWISRDVEDIKIIRR